MGKKRRKKRIPAEDDFSAALDEAASYEQTSQALPPRSLPPRVQTSSKAKKGKTRRKKSGSSVPWGLIIGITAGLVFVVAIGMGITYLVKNRDMFSVTPAPIEKIPDAAEVKKHMTPAQLTLGDPVVNSIGMLLVPIPAGEFQMGSPDSDSDARRYEKPQHLVKITKPYYMSAFEVTQHQYEKVMGSRPWQDKDNVQAGPNNAATYVSHNDAMEFCRKLSKQEGVDYRLPTEAEWEYACRAGTTTAYSFGDDASKLGKFGWYFKNTWEIGEGYAHRVGQKLCNPWGLYDMHGNAYEWCQDWSHSYGSEKKVVSDPLGPAQGLGRMLRDGAWWNQPQHVRSAVRHIELPTARFNIYGFRPLRTYNLSP